ncbi:glycoside hydrolase family 43 protein [soil metagenome]
MGGRGGTISRVLDRRDIRIRDPFVLVDGGRYWLYGTTDASCWEGPGVGFDAYVSDDLERWDGPHTVFRPGPGFWGRTNFWAPEVHLHRGRYVMLASFTAPGRHRATHALVADGPLGLYQPLATEPLTPPGWECLDGTLHLDDAGTPWLVFCREWLQVGDGEMCAVPLAADLTAPAGEASVLFRASHAPWTAALVPGESLFATDGPFMHRSADGNLLLLWSSTGREGYAMGLARSAGGLAGPWEHRDEPLVAGDGGHGMLFRDLAGRLLVTFHRPNVTPHERPHWRPVVEADGWLAMGGDPGGGGGDRR